MIAGLKPQFHAKVESGAKRHTIRKGKRWRVGMRIDLFANVRQKNMRLIFRAPVTAVEPIQIVIDVERQRLWAWVHGEKLSDSELEQLAVADGFEHGVSQMYLFWLQEHGGEKKKGYPQENIHFDGQVVHWDYAKRSRSPTDMRRACPGNEKGAA